MIPENRKFQLPQNQPSIHWEEPYTPEFPDLDHFYHAAVKIAKQYFVLRENADKDNTEGISDLFGKSIMRIFRTLVYSKLSYLPNYLSAFNLWKLCVFAEPELEKLELLFEKCSGEHFFRELNNHNRFHYGISRLKEEELLIMDEILQLLMQKLEVACSCINDK